MLDAHPEKETLAVIVNIPAHDERVTTPLFIHSKAKLIEREGGKCWLTGKTEAEVGPLEAHHYPIERCLAECFDWEDFAIDCKAGAWGKYAQAFDWGAFFVDATSIDVPEAIDPDDGRTLPAYTYLKPRDPYLFVDDMTVNGMLLSKASHIGRDEGIHYLPFPFWIAQKYGLVGYRFTPTLTINRTRVTK